MPLLHVVILALVQGITEFLPVSSSGHLVLAWEAFDLAGLKVPQQTESERLAMDVAVHVGTLFAVCVYFRRDIWQMVAGLLRCAMGHRDQRAGLAFYVAVGSIPLGFAGYYFQDFIELQLHNVAVVAWATLGFAFLLLASDRMGMTIRRMDHMNVGSALVVGLFQVLALVPGTSRSGITMTAARFLGFEPVEAARFSLLLSIPAIAGAGGLKGWELYGSGNLVLGLEALLGAAVAFLFALIAIFLMMGWLRRAGFTPFVIYRVLLGGLLLFWLYGGA